MPLEIVTVPCRVDNYAFLARDEATGTVAVADAPDGAPILRALSERGWRPALLFLTHHHDDHVAGTDALRDAFPGLCVVGAAADAHRLPPLGLAVAPGDGVAIGAEQGRVIDVSGHTVGHVAYHFPAARVAFTGDSLMALGCGRVFEGNFDMMWHSLSRLAALPDDTLICSGHEYTEANARFAATLDGQNAALVRRREDIQRARARGKPTVPSLLGEERATNPFLRAADPEMKAALGMTGRPDAEVFAEIRRRKDAF